MKRKQNTAVQLSKSKKRTWNHNEIGFCIWLIHHLPVNQATNSHPSQHKDLISKSGKYFDLTDNRLGNDGSPVELYPYLYPDPRPYGQTRDAFAPNLRRAQSADWWAKSPSASYYSSTPFLKVREVDGIWMACWVYVGAFPQIGQMSMLVIAAMHPFTQNKPLPTNDGALSQLMICPDYTPLIYHLPHIWCSICF